MRISPASRSRRWAIIAPYTDKKLQRRRHPVQAAAGRRHARACRQTVCWTIIPAIWKRLSAGDKGVVRVASIYAPTAIPSPARSSTTSWPGWKDCGCTPEKLLAPGRAGGADGRLQHHSEDKDAAKPKAWLKDACSSRSPRRRCGGSKISAIPTPSAACIRRRPLHLLGLFRLLGTQQRHPHRSHPVVAAGRGPAQEMLGSTKRCRGRRLRSLSDHVPVAGVNWRSERRFGPSFLPLQSPL